MRCHISNIALKATNIICEPKSRFYKIVVRSVMTYDDETMADTPKATQMTKQNKRRKTSRKEMKKNYNRQKEK